MHEEIVEEGFANSVVGKISSELFQDETILSCVKDGQIVNSPVVSLASKRAVSEDSSDLDSVDRGVWKKVLPKWVS